MNSTVYIQIRIAFCALFNIQQFQLRLSPEQSEKVEYERERLLGIANKFTTLIEVAVYFDMKLVQMLLCDANFSEKENLLGLT
jgi:hypothetical protein